MKKYSIFSQRFLVFEFFTLFVFIFFSSSSLAGEFESRVSNLYIFGSLGKAVGSENEKSELYSSVGLGYEINDYFDVQWGGNKISHGELNEESYAFFSDVRGRYSLNKKHSLYGLLGFRSGGDNTQLGVGVLYHHNVNWTMDFGYRYFSQPNDVLQGDVYAFSLGLEYKFSNKLEHSTEKTYDYVKKDYIYNRRSVNYYFENNSVDLKSSDKERILELINVLKVYPQATLRITGHTDSKGSGKYNLDLSMKRAISMSRFITERGIEQSRLSLIAVGEKFPISDNVTERGRALNRRVTIVVPEFTYSN